MPSLLAWTGEPGGKRRRLSGRRAQAPHGQRPAGLGGAEAPRLPAPRLPPRAALREQPKRSRQREPEKKGKVSFQQPGGRAAGLAGVLRAAVPGKEEGSRRLSPREYVKNKSVVSCYVCAIWAAACCEEMYIDCTAKEIWELLVNRYFFTIAYPPIYHSW